MYVTDGSAVARTPARSVIVGAAVRAGGGLVRTGVGDGGGGGGVVEPPATATARLVGDGDGEGVAGGAVVGVSVRNGLVGIGVGSGVGSGVGLFATGGWSGALGFFGCASA